MRCNIKCKVNEIKKKSKPRLKKLRNFRDKTLDGIEDYFESDRKETIKLKPRFRRKIRF